MTLSKLSIFNSLENMVGCHKNKTVAAQGASAASLGSLWQEWEALQDLGTAETATVTVWPAYIVSQNKGKEESSKVLPQDIGNQWGKDKEGK